MFLESRCSCDVRGTKPGGACNEDTRQCECKVRIHDDKRSRIQDNLGNSVIEVVTFKG